VYWNIVVCRVRIPRTGASVSVLHDNARDGVLIFEGDAVSNRGAIVLYVDNEPLQAQSLEEEFFDMVREVVEGVLELVHSRCIAIAKPDVIGRDDVKFIRQLRNQVSEHVGRAGKPMQQHDGWKVFAPGFTVEHLASTNSGVLERCHPRSLQKHAVLRLLNTAKHVNNGVVKSR
jgi:hypothetical protein